MEYIQDDTVTVWLNRETGYSNPILFDIRMA
jgi:hypothetical protein